MGPAEAVEVTTVLHGMGLAGAVITVLLSVVGSLAAVIVWMQRRADKVYGYRLAERDALNKALTEAASAQQAQAAATSERNQLQDQLSETITSLTQSIALFIERQTVHHEHLVTDQGRMITVIDAIAEAMRNASLTTTGVKDKLDTLLNQLPGMTKELKEHIRELAKDIEDAKRRSR